MATDPGAPPPSSPFLAVLRPLQTIMRLDAPAGFATRIVVLKYVTAVAGLGALIQLSLLALDYHRRGWSTFWLFEKVSRRNGRGRIICINSKVVSSLMSLICLVLNICYLDDMNRALFLGGSQTLTQAWRAFVPLAIVMHLWHLSFAQPAGWLAGLRDEDIVSARTFNGIFQWSSWSFLISMFAAATWTAITGARFWQAFEPLENKLLALDAAYKPGDFYGTSMFALQPLIAQFSKWGELNHQSSIILYSTCTAVVLCIFAFNIGFITLALVARRRSRAYHLDPEILVSDLTLRPVSTIASSLRGAKAGSEVKLSGSDMRLLATQRHTVLGVQAGQALAAAKAERDVVLMGTWCAFIALGGAAIGLYVSIPLLGLRIWAMDVWAVHESALTILQWLYAVLLIGLYPSLILSAWKNLSPPAHPGRFWRWFDHLAIIFPCLPSATHGESNSANPRPRAGAAAGGRVRVIIEEHTEEAYRHDLPPTERLETIIEGGVFLDHSKEADASELGVRGGDGIGVEWIKPSWAAEGGALRVPEGEGGTGRSREARVSSLRWDDSLGTAPIESTAAQHVTPWAWYDRRPSA